MIVVAVPPAVVMVVPFAVKVVVPDGANQTLSVADPPDEADETIVTEAPPWFEVDEAKTVSWLVGAVVSYKILFAL